MANESTDKRNCDCALTVSGALFDVQGTEATVSLPATVWYLLGSAGGGEVCVVADSESIPTHRLAMRLACIDASGHVEQLQTDTLFPTRPDAGAFEEPADEQPPYCGHAGNAVYESDDAEHSEGGAGGADNAEHPENGAGGSAHAEHPGNKPGAATPESSEDCDDTGTNDET